MNVYLVYVDAGDKCFLVFASSPESAELKVKDYVDYCYSEVRAIIPDAEVTPIHFT